MQIALSQFKLAIILFIKLVLVNLPVGLIILLLLYFEYTTIAKLVNLYLVLDCFIAILLFYIFKKYVRLKI
jgi:hypothetical protein